MKKLFWKIKYARYLKKKLGISMKMAFQSAESALENIDYDLEECPIDCAQSEIFAWAAESVE